MAGPQSWQLRAAALIYDAYPSQDLLPIDPPSPGEKIRNFAIRAEQAGDTLFLFLCREASDDIDAAEYVARLDRAIDDIEHVRAVFTQVARSGNRDPKQA